MATLVTIGDFSKMTYLTVKALRHYHDIGLLEPVSIDEQNGYRLYAIDQVAIAEAIRRFRELDMPTDEIKTLLASDDDATRNAVIVGHLDRMESQLEQTRGTVAGLRMLLDETTKDPAVTYRTLAPTLAVAIREKSIRRRPNLVRAGLRRTPRPARRSRCDRRRPRRRVVRPSVLRGR